MSIISPPFSTLNAWLLEDPIISHNIIHQEQENYNNYNFLPTERLTETSGNSIDLHSPSSAIQSKNAGEFSSFPGEFCEGGFDKIAKKINHNASERDRRKKINTMYCNLRSLLPPEDQAKKLSIPATVSRVLKYIPELQKEVERLVQKKEDLMSKVSRKQADSNMDFENHRRKLRKINSLAAVSATRISDREIIIQSSIPKIEKGSFSESLSKLEHEGLLVLNASCFESTEGRVFSTLHLQAQGSKLMDTDILKDKLGSFYERGEEIVL